MIIAGIVLFLGGIAGLVFLTGALDFIPRLRATAESPDGKYTVSVYQKRLVPRPFFPRMGAIARVYDRDQDLVYERTIFSDDDWDDTLGGAYTSIAFVDNEIQIGPGYFDRNKPVAIRLSELDSNQ
jgi:hypothetical protein